jgi:hypothetical protein
MNFHVYAKLEMSQVHGMKLERTKFFFGVLDLRQAHHILVARFG